MATRALAVLVLLACTAAPLTAKASTPASDGGLCLATADQIDAGETVSEAEKDEAHKACRRAIRATGSVLQKYQFEEADFAITGKRHKY